MANLRRLAAERQQAAERREQAITARVEELLREEQATALERARTRALREIGQ